MRRLSSILTAAAIGLLPFEVWAGPKVDQSCPRNPGHADNCTPLVACLPQPGIYFTGRAFGWSKGSLAGVTSAGYACTGTWTTEGFLGAGKAELDCDNGLTGLVLFTYQDGATGTTTGFGGMSDGQRIQVWSGHNIRQFLINGSDKVDVNLLCRGVEVPIG